MGDRGPGVSVWPSVQGEREAYPERRLSALEAGHPRLVCDLAQTDFICSDALGVLITAYLKARGRGGFLRLAGLPPQLREILETTRLDRLFEVFPSIQDAVERA